MNDTKNNEEWDLILKPKTSLFRFGIKETWAYRYLIFLFVKRDLKAQYKQTLLGPLWHIIQPIITTFMYTLIFSFFAKIPTGGLPPALFYLSGIVIWYFFSSCIGSTSGTFVSNASIFGKIYFPRMVVPVSVIISNISRYIIQLGLFGLLLLFYFIKGAPIHVSPAILLILPVISLILAIMGLGFGIIVSSLTTKYRDLSFFLGFALQLFMYLTPIIYPPSFLGKYAYLLKLNPLTPIIENFRACFFEGSSFDFMGMCLSGVFAVIVLFIGLILFNKVEKTFMDTV